MRGLRGRSKEVCDFFDAFGKVELGFLSEVLAVGFCAVKEIRVNVEEGVVLLVLGFAKLA